jgi:hypothetical protein
MTEKEKSSMKELSQDQRKAIEDAFSSEYAAFILNKRFQDLIMRKHTWFAIIGGLLLFVFAILNVKVYTSSQDLLNAKAAYDSAKGDYTNAKNKIDQEITSLKRELEIFDGFRDQYDRLLLREDEILEDKERHLSNIGEHLEIQKIEYIALLEEKSNLLAGKLEEQEESYRVSRREIDALQESVEVRTSDLDDLLTTVNSTIGVEELRNVVDKVHPLLKEYSSNSRVFFSVRTSNSSSVRLPQSPDKFLRINFDKSRAKISSVLVNLELHMKGVQPDKKEFWIQRTGSDTYHFKSDKKGPVIAEDSISITPNHFLKVVHMYQTSDRNVKDFVVFQVSRLPNELSVSR